MSRSKKRILCLVPIYNDSHSASLVAAHLGEIAESSGWSLSILFVDDGSSVSDVGSLTCLPPSVVSIEVLSLRRNVGHQRAIAIGLAFIESERAADYVVVMDGDGEDCPSTLPPLLSAALEGPPYRAVFGRRLKRQEGLGFLLGYYIFRLLHLLLVGRDINVGNYSVLPRPVLERVVGVSEIWNHYAAAVFHARIPATMIPVIRGSRLAGRSQMSLVSLVIHGLSALAVWGDVIIARLLLVTGVLLAALASGIGFLGLRSLFSDSPYAATLYPHLVFALTLSGAVALALLLLAIHLIGARNATMIMPLRDWKLYVLTTRTTEPRNASAVSSGA